jgi:hypothetical protein
MPSGGPKTHSSDNWIAGAIKNPGGLHKSLGVPSGKNIPAKDLEIKDSDSSKLKKQKTLAKTLKGMKHG